MNIPIGERFRQFLHDHRPRGTTCICPKCGSPSPHSLVYCKLCGSSRAYVNFKDWVEFADYIYRRKYKGKYNEAFYSWPNGWFGILLESEMGLLEAYKYQCTLSPGDAHKIIWEECKKRHGK